MRTAPRRLLVALLLASVPACSSTTSPAGDVQLRLGCSSLDLPRPSGMDECTASLVPVSGQTGTIESVTLIGANGQPISQDAGFPYGGGVGLVLYSRPTPSSLAGRTFGPAAFELEVVAVISPGEGQSVPAAGTYPAAVRVTHRLGAGASTTLEVAVPIRVL